MADSTTHDDEELKKIQRHLSDSNDELGRSNFSNHAFLSGALDTTNSSNDDAEKTLREAYEQASRFLKKYEKLIDSVDDFLENTKKALTELHDNVHLARNDYQFREQTNMDRFDKLEF